MSSLIPTEETLRATRWFAGKHRRIASVRALATWREDRIGVVEIAYADDGAAAERYLVLDDDALGWRALLMALREAPLAGPGGRIELRATPALGALLDDDAGTGERLPSLDQSNTLVLVGDTLLVKAYRRLERGVHPEVELGAALAGTDAPVPAFGGALHWVALDGEDTAIALLQEFVPGALSGWEPPIESAVEHLRAGTVDPAPYAAAGAATGALHAALAARTGWTIDATAPSRWLADALGALAEAEALDPIARAAAPAIRARLTAALNGAAHGATRLTRVHGDLHFAQFLRTPQRTFVIDLEGDPMVSLERRRRPDTPLRDVAALLRSIDHIGSAAAHRMEEEEVDPAPFVATASRAALDAYMSTAPTTVDLALLDALQLIAELRELLYAHRILPEWLYVPRAGIHRLTATPT